MSPPSANAGRSCRLILERQAGEIAAFELAAGGLGGRLVEAGEARAVERLVALLHLLGKRIGGGERLANLAAGFAQMLASFLLAVIGADLNDPSAMPVPYCRNVKHLLDGGGFRSFGRRMVGLRRRRNRRHLARSKGVVRRLDWSGRRLGRGRTGVCPGRKGFGLHGRAAP